MSLEVDCAIADRRTALTLGDVSVGTEPIAGLWVHVGRRVPVAAGPYSRQWVRGFAFETAAARRRPTTPVHSPAQAERQRSGASTHVSGLIADGWDRVEVAGRIGDTLATTLGVYGHAFDSNRRSEHRRGALEARYGGMATGDPISPGITGAASTARIARFEVVRNG